MRMRKPQDCSPVGNQLADREERRRENDVPPLRRLLSIRRGATTGTEQEVSGQGHRKALQLGKGALVLLVALAALLVIWLVSLWLIHSPSPAGAFWRDRLPHL
jgi:hypothetical protein